MTPDDLEQQSVPIDSMRTARTPTPPDWKQAQILMERNLRNDLKKPYLWAGKTVAIGAFLMLYTLGFFLSYEAVSGSTVFGDYRIFDGQNWTYPSRIIFAGADMNFTEEIIVAVTDEVGFDIRVENAGVWNVTQFQEDCTGNLGTYAADGVCVFLESNSSYTIYYGGKEESTPYQFALAGAQWAVNRAFLDVKGIPHAYPVSEIQRTPELVNDDTVEPNIATLLTTGIMHVLAGAIMLMFITGPLITEKLSDVTLSFQRVGVKLMTYMMSWFLYLSLNGLITAGVLTIVSVYYRLFPMSNAGFIFASHYLGLIQLYAQFVLASQIITQEELAQGIPWLSAFGSMAIAVPIILADSVKSILMTILAVPLPFVGVIQYYGIYVTYDNTGYNTGIGLDNFADSGLMANMIAQVCGVLFYLFAMHVFASERIRIARPSSHVQAGAEGAPTNPDFFEPLPPGSEVVLSVRSLHHTYRPVLCKPGKPAEVLKGLDLDICRDEIFAYLGHNGAGKTTSVKILSAELALQDGSIEYRFREGGGASMERADDLNRIRSKIGVCPQHNDALQDNLTCRETLRLFAKLKGQIKLEPNQTVDEAVEAEVDRRIQQINFTSEEDSEKLVGTYSGGMKRKVNIALALLGDPEVVFLDEPTAGMDPYNRRQIWDMISQAKRGRSIILLTHHLDEAEVLSDRVAILKGGKVMTCGSSLFLKHQFGVGYRLNFESPQPVEIVQEVPGAERLPTEKAGTYQYRLSHGTEQYFPQALRALDSAGATKVSVDLTTLEEVFLETGKEDGDDEAEFEDEGENDDVEGDLENPETNADYLAKIWEPRAQKRKVGFWRKFLLVQSFMMQNALRMKGTIFLNITMPMAYLIGGLFVGTLVDTPSKGELVVPDTIPILPSVGGESTSLFFGVPDLNLTSILPVEPSGEPQTIEGYFDGGSDPFMGGYYQSNNTLQYNPAVTPFCLQIGAAILTEYSAAEDDALGVASSVQQLPYETDVPFRVDILVVPMAVGFGFAGLAFVLLDVLLLKADNIVGLFRVAGIPEWDTYMGIMSYKFVTTFLPFFILVIILGIALSSVIMGNAGRWLGTLLMMLAYAYSTTPIGLILAKKFIHGDFKAVSNWFPGVYMSFVSLPYVAWSSVLQALPDSRDTILVIGDIMSIVPQVAFQRGIGAIIDISTDFQDDRLTWSTVWSWESRVWFTLLLMVVTGTLEWYFLWRLTTLRVPPETLKPEEQTQAEPLDVSDIPDVAEERERSYADDEGINVRDIVKVFRVPSTDKSKEKVIKRANKGVSYGVRKNEIFALLGPNGAGKTTAMNVLAGEFSAENGEFALNGKKATSESGDISFLYEDCSVAHCPQFDALFERHSVNEHLTFYAKIRGLDWDDEAAQGHIRAIVKLLGLEQYKNTASADLSGGYKRRLSLAVAMIGYPRCMMVDEVTTGVDPGARRKIWSVLRPEIAHGSFDLPAILLSTHYMQEAETLGTRIGIMIDGEIVTTGSLNYLLDRYCTSFFVEISMEATSGETAEDDVVAKFESNSMPVEVYESLPFHFKLQVPFLEGTHHVDQLAKIFEILEMNKSELQIKFYSVAQMNLEQIFINLSRKQFEAEQQPALTSSRRLSSNRRLG